TGRVQYTKNGKSPQTKMMIDHINRHHANECPLSRRNVETAGAAAGAASALSASDTQGQKRSAEGGVLRQAPLSRFVWAKTSPENVRAMAFILLMLVACCLPVAIVEQPAFVAMILGLNPAVSM